MITKVRKPSVFTFTTSDGKEHISLNEAKRRELVSMCVTNPESADVESAFETLVTKAREAISILRMGLPRKPRAVKPPMGRKPRRNLKREMPEIPGV